MHRLVLKEDGTNLAVMRKGFKNAKKRGLELPILRNSRGNTAFDIVLETKTEKFGIFRQPRIIIEEEEEDKQPAFDRVLSWFKNHNKNREY